MHIILCIWWLSVWPKTPRVSEWRNQGWDGKNSVCQASVQLHWWLGCVGCCRGAGRKKHFCLSYYLLRNNRQNHFLFSIKLWSSVIPTIHTRVCTNFFLECAELSENFGQFWRICCFRWNIYRQCAVNPAVVAIERRNLFFRFMGDAGEKEHALISDLCLFIHSWVLHVLWT